MTRDLIFSVDGRSSIDQDLSVCFRDFVFRQQEKKYDGWKIKQIKEKRIWRVNK